MRVKDMLTGLWPPCYGPCLVERTVGVYNLLTGIHPSGTWHLWEYHHGSGHADRGYPPLGPRPISTGGKRPPGRPNSCSVSRRSPYGLLLDTTPPDESDGDHRSQPAPVRAHRPDPQFRRGRQAGTGQASGLFVQRLRRLQNDRGHRLLARQPARSRSGKANGRDHRQDRRRPTT